MIALPFIEVIKKAGFQIREFGNSKVGIYGVNNMEEVVEFYSQPFDIGMLVNPIEQSKYVSYIDNVNKCAKYYEDLKKWQEAEDKILFEGLKIKGISNTSGETVYVYIEGFKDAGFSGKNERDMFKNSGCNYVTLEDFIHDQNRKGKSLHWKQSIVDKYFNIK